jgi:hypothetical protein
MWPICKDRQVPIAIFGLEGFEDAHRQASVVERNSTVKRQEQLEELAKQPL